MVGRLVPPGVLILGTKVDQETEASCREALDETVQECLGLGIRPLEILEHEEQGLVLGFPKGEPPDRLEGALTPLGRIEGLPSLVVQGYVEEREKGRQAQLERRVEREEPPLHLLADRWRVVAVLDAEVRLEELDHGQIRGRLSVR